MKDTKALTLDDAKRMAAAAEAEAMAHNWTVSIAVCDAGGHPILLQRMDGAPLMSAAVAPEKARTCVLSGKPSKVFEDMVEQRSFRGAGPARGAARRRRTGGGRRRGDRRGGGIRRQGRRRCASRACRRRRAGRPESPTRESKNETRSSCSYPGHAGPGQFECRAHTRAVRSRRRRVPAQLQPWQPRRPRRAASP